MITKIESCLHQNNFLYTLKDMANSFLYILPSSWRFFINQRKEKSFVKSGDRAAHSVRPSLPTPISLEIRHSSTLR